MKSLDDKSLDTCSYYEKVLLVGVFNAQITDHCLGSFFINMNYPVLLKKSRVSKMFLIPAA